ncbi:MAG: TolC family protein, partial [Muribaculaceae bacterium]|nr:TolC family protein [Muribaculaceae bacterium]
MKINRIIVSFLSFAALVTSRGEDWTLQQCIDYALEHNIDIKLRQQDIESGQLQVSDSRHAFLPQINGSASQSFNFGRGLTAENTYANRNTSSFQVGANLSIPIFSGLRNSRTLEQSKLNLRSITWQLEQARDNVTLNIIAQYLQVLYNKEVVETATSQADLSAYE